MSGLRFKLSGKHDKRADFGDVTNFCVNLDECLRRAFRAQNGAVAKYPRFKINQLEIGSAIVSLIGDKETIEAVKSNIRRIRDGLTPLYRMRTDDLRRYRALADCLASETASIEIADTVIDEEFRAACDKLISKSPQSYGSAIGRLDGVNVHDRKFFRLYPEGQDRGVECFFAEELYVKVLEAMRKRVQVQGLIQRDPDGVGIDQIRQVQEVRIIPESKDLPSLRSLFGLTASFPNSAADRNSGWD